MGVDHSAYIGPYIRITETIRKETVDNCKDHNRPADAKFCPTCGKLNRLCIKEVGNAPDVFDYTFGGLFIRVLNIKAGMKTTNILVPNGHRKELGVPKIKGEKYSEEEVFLDDLDMKEITQKFHDLFVDELEELRQYFDVEVRFGYVGYCC